jgi:hypothetical protein
MAVLTPFAMSRGPMFVARFFHRLVHRLTEPCHDPLCLEQQPDASLPVSEPQFQGICFYDGPIAPSSRPYLSPPSVPQDIFLDSEQPEPAQPEKACAVAINAKFSLVALGLEKYDALFP